MIYVPLCVGAGVHILKRKGDKKNDLRDDTIKRLNLNDHKGIHILAKELCSILLV